MSWWPQNIGNISVTAAEWRSFRGKQAREGGRRRGEGGVSSSSTQFVTVEDSPASVLHPFIPLSLPTLFSSEAPPLSRRPSLYRPPFNHRSVRLSIIFPSIHPSFSHLFITYLFISLSFSSSFHPLSPLHQPSIHH